MMNEPLASNRARVVAGAGKAPRRAQSKLARAAFWPLVLVFLAADVILVQGAMTVVLGQGELLGWFASASLAVLAAYAAHEAGTSAREARIWSRLPWGAVVLLILFSGVVAGLTAIRWNAGALTDATIHFEGVVGAELQNELTHHLTAVALAPMLCMTGALTYLHGFNAKTSIEHEHELAASARARAQDLLVDLEGKVLRETLAMTQHEREIMTIGEQEQSHLESAAALAAEMKAYAHRRIYLALGTPNASGMTDPDPSPTND